MKLKPFLLLSIFIFISKMNYADCSVGKLCFKPGEKLYYKMKYNLAGIWINAGEATFSVHNAMLKGKPYYRYIGKGGTFGRMVSIFNVNDLYQSYVDKTTLMPVYFRRDVSEGKEEFSSAVQFSRNEKIARSRFGNYRITSCTQDVMSAVYWCRTQNLSNRKPGEEILVDVFLDNSRYDIRIKYLGKEKVQTNFGEIEAYKVSPTLIDGLVFDKNSKMYVWVTADKDQVPVKIQTSIIVGKVVGELESYENLMYPSLLDQ